MAGREKRYLAILICLLVLALALSPAAGAEAVPIVPEHQDSPVLWELDSGKDGSVILIVAGIHGDEVSGILAAEELTKLTIESGKLFWIPAANTYGAENNRRKTRDDRDLNRNFPGDPEGNSTKQLAAGITRQILEIQPDLILDLHEATAWEDGWDNLGNSVIFADLNPVADLIFEWMDMDTVPNFFSSPPAGSLNAYFSEECEIPVLTLEASRADSMETRMEFHRQMIQFVLFWYGML